MSNTNEAYRDNTATLVAEIERLNKVNAELVEANQKLTVVGDDGDYSHVTTINQVVLPSIVFLVLPVLCYVMHPAFAAIYCFILFYIRFAIQRTKE